MGLRDEVIEMKKEVEAVKKESFAMELLKDSKNANKRICFSFTAVIMLMIIMYFVTVGLFLKHISDTGIEETTITTKTQELEDIDNISNANIVNGDMYGENKTNNNNQNN